MDTLNSIFKRSLILVPLSAVVLLMLLSCTGDKGDGSLKKLVQNDYTELIKKVNINSQFGQEPPIAKNTSFEVLKKPTTNGENIRFTAEFDKAELKAKFKGNYLAVLLGDEKVVLRDDGKGADLKANDNKFSVFLKQNIKELEGKVIESQEVSFNQRTKTIFKNREAINIKTADILPQKFTEFIKGKINEIPLLFNSDVNNIDPKKSLMITDISVVEDPKRTFNPCTRQGNPKGVWTFGELMRQLASPNPSSITTNADVSKFVLNWLNTWNIDETINGESIQKRTDIESQIIQPWLSKSLAAGAPNGQLKMELAPFKLNAIVNRFDLRGNLGYGFGDAGEGRFVFNAFNSVNCNPLEFTVIFEYGITKKSCNDITNYALNWQNLTNTRANAPNLFE